MLKKSRRTLQEERELPRDLEAWLRSLPDRLILCRDVHRLWAPWLQAELEAVVEARLAEHLEGCPLCRETVRALDSARSAPPEPSEALVGKLRAIPGRERGRQRRRKPPSAPWWILDLRLAATACYGLAILAVALCGEPAKCLGHAASWARPAVSAVEKVGGILSGEELTAPSTPGPAGLWNDAVELLRSRSRPATVPDRRPAETHDE